MANIKTTNFRANIWQANELVDSYLDFTLEEIRFFHLCLSTVYPNLPDSETEYRGPFPETIIEGQKIINEFGGNKAYWNIIDSLIRSLYGRAINIGKGKNIMLRHIFEKLDWIEEDEQGNPLEKKYLRVQFHREMTPYIMDLVERPYVKLARKTAFKLNSAYAVRIIEIVWKIKKLKYVDHLDIELSEFKRLLNVPEDAYPGNMDGFRRKVIDGPLKEIKSKLGIKIEYDKIKNGRKITGFRFYIR